jgi:hypothetical protein
MKRKGVKCFEVATNRVAEKNTACILFERD